MSLSRRATSLAKAAGARRNFSGGVEHHHIHDKNLKDIIQPPGHILRNATIKSPDRYFTMHRQSLEDPARFWGPIAESFQWHRKWDKVVEWEFDTPKIEWFKGGELNITVNALDRHIAAGFGDRPAMTWESDSGESETYTFSQILSHVNATAQVLEANGVKKGDRVSLYFPMIPQLMFTMLACARMGAVHSTIFGGFSAEAVAERIVNCKSDVVVTADAGVRGGKVVPLKPVVDAAVAAAEKRGVKVRRVLVHHRAGEGAHEGASGWVKGRDYSLDTQISEAFRNSVGRGAASVDFKPAIMNSEDPLFILYTSGSTGTPKGVLHTTGGYMVYAATTFKHIFDTRPSAAHYPKLGEATNDSLNLTPTGTAVHHPNKDGSAYKSGVPGTEFYKLSHSGHPDKSSTQVGADLRAKSHDVVSPDLHFCTADVGWVTGHSYITYGPLLNGTHTLMFEGVPTYPGPDRFWQVAAKHKATTLYTAPTAIRALMVHGNEPVAKHDLSSLRILGSVGEPINAEAWRWFHSNVGKGKCSLVDTWWQTECGGVMISNLPATQMKPGIATKPFFGVDARVVRPDGTECDAEEAGYLVIDKPWPGMMRTVYGDHERFRKTYFAEPGMKGRYFTGDGAVRDADGDIAILGRTDDVVNVSGHRLGTAEVESAIALHPEVAEAAVVGVPHQIKGESLYAFVILKNGKTWTDSLQKELIATVRKQIGAIAQPDAFHPTADLPKTRSGKIMRRVLRKIAAGEKDLKQMGDTSTLANPAIVQELIATAKKVGSK